MQKNTFATHSVLFVSDLKRSSTAPEHAEPTSELHIQTMELERNATGNLIVIVNSRGLWQQFKWKFRGTHFLGI